MSNNISSIKQEDSSWDLVIESKTGVFKLNLQQVWKYRDLLWLLVRRDFVSFYKQTIFGPLWFFIQPLFTMGMYVFVFGGLAGISTDGLPQPLFYLVGITAWSYFSDCLVKVSTVFKDNSGIFGKVYFPRIIMPLSIVFSNLVRFGVQMFLLLVTMAYYYFKGYSLETSLYILLLPVLIISMALMGLGMGMIVSALTTKYRDLAFLLNFGVQLLMYATTVIYPLSSLSGTMRTVISLNPMTPIIEGMRLGFLGKGSFELSDLFYTLVVTLIILLSGIMIFNKVEKNVIDTI
jgi:lipopolysaccharide transport system permease protein